MKVRMQRHALLALFLLSAGCAAPVKKKDVAVFFPPPPELPRIEFLASWSGSKDIETQSAFNRFVVGEKKNVKLGKPYGIAVYDGRVYEIRTDGKRRKLLFVRWVADQRDWRVLVDLLLAPEARTPPSRPSQEHRL